MESKASFDVGTPSYSKFQPKINLEVLSAKSANKMILLTYLVFVICLFLDIFSMVQILSISTKIVPSNSCTTCDTKSTDPYTYSHYFYNQINVVTYDIQISQSNFTGLVDWTTGSQPHICSEVSLNYDLSIWACYLQNGCTSFDQPNSNANNENSWHISKQIVNAFIKTDMCELKSLHDHFKHILLDRTYQFEVINE